jgi:hypothetical protein
LCYGYTIETAGALRPEQERTKMIDATEAQKVLAKASLFAGLSNEALASIAKIAQTKNYEEGDDVYKLGDPASAVYVPSAWEIAHRRIRSWRQARPSAGPR